MADPNALPDPNAGNNPNPLTNLFGGNFVNPAYATPTQRAMLYAYANQLMQPRPVKHWTQGLAEMADALVGGLAMNRPAAFSNAN